jgi:RHS repeat-associated protein
MSRGRFRMPRRARSRALVTVAPFASLLRCIGSHRAGYTRPATPPESWPTPAGATPPGEPRRSKPLVIILVVAACLCVGLAGVAVATRASGTPHATRRAPKPPNPMLSRQFAHQIAAARRRELARKKFLASPRAVAARKASRSKYRDQSASEAIRTDERAFRGAVGARGFNSLAMLGSKGRVLRQLNARQAVVEDSHGHRGLAVGMLPLFGQQPNGHKAPLNMALVDARNSFMPASALVPTSFPKRSDAPIALSHGKFGIAFSSGSAVPAVRAGDTLVFPNIETDTDTVLRPVPTGAEVSYELRSAASPQFQTLTFDLPNGWHLEPQKGLPVSSGFVGVVDGSGKTMATVLPPEATDAQGERVPARYSIRDATHLTIKVPHRSGRYAYPILVDPVVDDYVGSTIGSSPAWHTVISPSNAAIYFYCGPYGCTNPEIIGFANTAYPGGAAAEYYYVPPSGVYIYAFEETWVTHAVNNSDEYGGIVSWANGAWEPGVWSQASGQSGTPAARYWGGWENGQQWVAYCARSDCGGGSSEGIDTNNSAVFGLYIAGTTANNGQQPYMVLSGDAIVWESDYGPVTVGAPVNNPLWADTSGSANVPASEQSGLGIAQETVTGPNGLGGTAAPSCNGTHTAPCPLSYTGTVNFNTSSLPEGSNVFTAQAQDAAGVMSSTRQWNVDVDHQTPQAPSFAGLLWNNRYDPTGNYTGGSSQSNPMPDLNYPMQITGTDPGNASGPAEFDVQVDNNAPQAVQSACAPISQSDSTTQCGQLQNGNRVQTVNYRFNSDAYPAGEHTICVTLKDQVAQEQGQAAPTCTPASGSNACQPASNTPGHMSQGCFQVWTAPPATPTGQRNQLGLEKFWDFRQFPTGGGSELRVNEGTGNAVWDDMPMVDQGQGLSTFVSVAYNSQHLLGDLDPIDLPLLPNLEYDQIGQGFSLGIDGLTRLNEPLDLSLGALGRISFTTIYGTRETFVKDSSGNWDPPAGVFLHLRQYSSTNSDQTWAITRPDGVTFFFDDLGYETSIQDRTGNTLTFKRAYYLLDALSGNAGVCSLVGLQIPFFGQSLCTERVYEIDDQNESQRERQGEHKFIVCYYAPQGTSQDSGCDPGNTGRDNVPLLDPREFKVADVFDHAGRDLHFDYAVNSVNVGGLNLPLSQVNLQDMVMNYQDASPDPQRQMFSFGYGGSLGGADAQPVLGALPVLSGIIDPLLFPQGLTSITDPDGAQPGDPAHTTQIFYEAPQSSLLGQDPCPNNAQGLVQQTLQTVNALTGLEPKCVQKIIDREAGETDFGYAAGTDNVPASQANGQTVHITTVNGPRAVAGGTRPDNWADEIDGTVRPVVQENPVQYADSSGGHGMTVLNWGSSGGDGNQLDSLIDAYGRPDQTTTNFQYDQNGRLTDRKGPSLSGDTNPREVSISYQHSAGMLLAPSGADSGGTFVSDPTSMTDQDRHTWTFTLDPISAAPDGTARADGLVTTVTDPTSASWQTTYQRGQDLTYATGGGLVTSQTTPNAQTTTFGSFDVNGLPQTKTDASGGKYPDGNPIGGGSTRYTYNPLGDLLTVTDPRNPTGSVGNPGCSSATSSVPSYTIVFHYDDLQRVTDECASKDSSGNPTGSTSSLVHTHYAYDANGNLVSKLDGNAKTWSYTANPMDWLASQTTPKGETTRYAYDRNGDLIDQKQPLADTSGPVDSALGIPSNETGTGSSDGIQTSSTGHETAYAYDGAGEMLLKDQLDPASQQINPSVVDPDHLITYSYDDRGNPVGMADAASNAAVAKQVAGEAITAAQIGSAENNASVGPNPLTPSGSSWRTATAYDAASEPVQITTNPDATGGAQFFTIERRQYDADGNLLADQDARYSGSTPSSDGLGGFSLSDGQGTPNSRDISASGYDTRGLLTSQTDPQGNKTLYGRRADGKLCWQLSPNGVSYLQSQQQSLPQSNNCSAGTSLSYMTSYTYAAPGWLGSTTLPQAPGEYSYPASLTVNYERDQAGYPTTITDARGGTFTTSFYDNGELKSTGRPSWWTYDPQGSGTAGPDPNTAHQGQVSADTPGAGLPIREKTTQEMAGQAKRSEAVTLPQTQAQGNYGQVQPNQLPGILPTAGSATFSYDGNANLTSVTDAEGHATSLSYDDDGQLSTLDQPFNGSTHSTSTYTYDGDGNVKSVTTPAVHELQGALNQTDISGLTQTADNAETTSYTYDGLDRQTQQIGPGDNAGPNTYSDIQGPYQHETTDTAYALEPGVQVAGQGFGAATQFDVAQQVQTTDPRGSGAGDPNHTTIQDYDALGNLVEQDSPQVLHAHNTNSQRETTTYEYDQLGDQTRVVRPMGNPPFASGSGLNQYGQDLNYATTNAYNSDGQLTTSTKTAAYSSESPQTLTTSSHYDSDGNTTEVDRPSADGQNPQITYDTYNGRDLPWTTTTGLSPGSPPQPTANTRTTVTEYDGNGNLIRTVNPAGAAPGAALPGASNQYGPGGVYHTYSGNYDDASSPGSHSPEKQNQDANIDATVRVYDPSNSLIAVYQPWGCNISSTATQCADAQITDQRRFRQDYGRNDLGELSTHTSAYDWTGTVSSPHNTSSYSYYDNGWVKQETDPTVSPSTGETTSYTYDPAGDETSWQQKGTLSTSNGGNPYGPAVTRAYYPDGQPAQVKGTAQTSHTYSYYHLPTGQTDYLQGALDSGTETQQLAFDDTGRLLAVNDNVQPASGPTLLDTVQFYNPDGALAERRTNGTLPTGGSITNAIANDQYTGGQTTSFTYDSVDRERTMTVAPNPNYQNNMPDPCPAPQGAQPCRTFTTAYAASGQPSQATRTQDGGAQITENYAYNNDGTIHSDTRSPSDGKSLTYGYDMDANRTQDERGSHVFNAQNQEIQWTRGGPDTQAPGSTVNYTLDGDGAVLQAVEHKALTGISSPQPGYPNESINETFDTTTQDCSQASASYTNVSAQSWQPCQHDAGRAENIASKQTVTVTAVNNGPGGHLPPPSTTWTDNNNCYDQVGQNRRVVQAGKTTQSTPPATPGTACPADPLATGLQGENANTTTLYGYDGFGRETSSQGPDPASANPASPNIVGDTYTYDGLDRRVSKSESVNGNAPNTYGYDYVADSNEVSQDTNTSGNLTDTYDYNSSGQRMGANAATGSGNTYHPYAHDASGSVEALENKDGTVATNNRYHYTPYGDLEMGAGDLQQAESSGNFSNATPENTLGADAQASKYRFEGFYYDSGVQTYDMLARPYRPNSGQFLVSDRFEQALGDQQLAADPLTQNRYAFAGGNPTSNVEYDGHGCIPTDPSDPTHYHYCSAGGGYAESSQTNPTTGQTTSTTSGPAGVIRSVTTSPGSSSGSPSSAPPPSARAVAPAASVSALEQQIRATNAALSGASTAGAVAQAKTQLAQLKAQLASVLVNQFENSCSNEVSGAQAIAYCNFANSPAGQALTAILGPVGSITKSVFGGINTASNVVFWGCVGTGDPFCAGAAEGISALTGAAGEIGSTTDPLIEASNATNRAVGAGARGLAPIAGGAPGAMFERAGINTTEHFLTSLAGRVGSRLSESDALDAYRNGRLYFDPATGNYVRYSSRSEVAVVTTEPSNGTAVTAFEGRPSSRWVPVPWRPGQ